MLRASSPSLLTAIALFLFILTACDTGTSSTGASDGFDIENCSLPPDRFVDGGVGRNGIPALTNPTLVGAEAASYLADSDRIIGLTIGDRTIAVPHNILWWHEIINFDLAGRQLAVTYCPLTGSSLAFDRSAVGDGEFGVSGLLFNNNLVMFDRTSQESLWPQMNRQAGCGPRNGTELSMVAVVEMEWDSWRSIHPDTEVVSNETGFNRNYTTSGYPYGNYEEVDNDRLLFDIPIDNRRPPKERLLGIPSAEGGLALPFGQLDDAAVRAVSVTVGGTPMVVFWNRAARGAMAFLPTLDGEGLAFTVRDGRIVDTATESTWTVDGRAVDGPRAGARLEPVNTAYVAFWFAWATFQPETDIWTEGADA